MKERTFDFVKADPAGNITGFVVWPVDPNQRAAYANAIMEQIDSSIEQVGFISPSYDGPPLRMDMMGSEFCGNATRSYGLYAASFEDFQGEGEIEVYVSGVKGPITVKVDKEKSTASVEIPKAKAVSEIELEGTDYKVIELEGIVHTIIDNREEDEKFVKAALEKIQQKFEEEAYGVLFLNKDTFEMVPYVYVKGSDTLIREGSCGSGTVATATYLTLNSKEETFEQEIKQPKGSIVATGRRDEEGDFVFSIGGYVELSDVEKVTIKL
ncbi:hypothetical protein [Anaerosphaera multitolerans]|uniref:Diaminopimelate epimerase n=1 Tax=Anaerosphaera multitolerans TaxID=2487351 RepID=A0A437S932_9FIRM|nr:hypothetical protein [Anaerosphaera multitolerans]RVU55512.1 hypothetical protein EF514_01935 [Anaerosphaera multitolerans]